ncbi:MAG: 3-methyl-2-oxobutanoate hydroxymethyltransferase [Lentisphaerae bacterium]|jgi:3-methyl-2-oxobutanoate hydroxymethyltransferase|nr:3-methyl-2-oxobutanoate hydroxymethyltransferase [Lentisphaerota bacterium]
MKTWTTTKIRAAKGGDPIPCLTAYDFSTARLIDEAGIPLVLVGDSLGNTMLGFDSTIPVTLAHMIHHTTAVTRAVRQALVVADMPFMTYQVSDEQALTNAARLVQEGGADAVKLEGGSVIVNRIERLVESGIPVMGHLGLTPQFVNQLGGYKVQGKNEEDARQMIDDAVAIAEAGAFSLVLECVPANLARQITEMVPIPTVGIGAGPYCDGQVLVYHDMLGLNTGRVPSFVKPYADLGNAMSNAFKQFAQEVKDRTFPDAAHSFGMKALANP